MSDDAASLNSQGIEASEGGMTYEGLSSPSFPTVTKKKRTIHKRQGRRAQEPHKEKATVDPCKYKTKLCRSWMRDGRCSYESVCCYSHGPHDLRTVQQNTQVLCSLGYFTDSMQSTTDPDEERTPGIGFEADRAALAEANLVHLAMQAAQTQASVPHPPPPLCRTLRPPPPPPRTPHPAHWMQPTVHVPYSGGSLYPPQLAPAWAGPSASGIRLPLPHGLDPFPPYTPYGPYSTYPSMPPTLPPYGYLPHGMNTAPPSSYDLVSRGHTEPPWQHPPATSPGFPSPHFNADAFQNQ